MQLKPLAITFVFLISAIVSAASVYSRQIRGPLVEIRKEVSEEGLPFLQGHIPGYPGHYGAFISYYPKIAGVATIQDVELMLTDPNPVVRLVGAKIAMNRGLRTKSLGALSTDNAPVWVGPFYDGTAEFRKMAVSEVMVELRNDPWFQSRTNTGASVNLDWIKENAQHDGSRLIVGRLPEYPFEMARAGMSGDITVRITFKKGAPKPEVKVLKSSNYLFEEPTIWALSKWEMKEGSPTATASSYAPEYECHLDFRIFGSE